MYNARDALKAEELLPVEGKLIFELQRLSAAKTYI